MRSLLPEPSSTNSSVSDDVGEDINTHPTLVIALGPVLLFFAEPHPEFHKLLQGKYHAVASVGYDGVQRISLKRAVAMVTPGTVAGYVRHLAFFVNKLRGTD